jgi:hypothetical protein
MAVEVAATMPMECGACAGGAYMASLRRVECEAREIDSTGQREIDGWQTELEKIMSAVRSTTPQGQGVACCSLEKKMRLKISDWPTCELSAFYPTTEGKWGLVRNGSSAPEPKERRRVKFQALRDKVPKRPVE